MKILVCIKQVPGTTQVEIDETTGTLKRDGVPAKMNPFDLYALETLSPEVRALMRGIKAAFDPKNILNPGKVVA